MNPKEIKFQDQTLALFFPKTMSAEGGIKFLTPIDYPLQIGLLEHKEGKMVPPHIHRDLHYNVNTTQEFIYIEKGEGVEVAIFTKEWEEVDRLVMSAGDSILFVSGGHSVNIPKGCRLFEVKQGPYPGDKEAKMFKD
ncbi:MAG: hypothetical protein NTV81_04855 [Candidatus Komeilibacteria bacterium]|nr:hypothetical protein [Candidatus Komeilibacteria bacterium]